MPVSFLCNICSLENFVESLQELDPESSLCDRCGSNVRFRWIVHSLSTAFFGESLCLRDFPEAKQIKGIGLSDATLYADRFAEKLSYTNTFYHCEPQFNVKDLGYGIPSSLDFIIASEVFEHVTYPVQPAFDNLRRLLKPDGVIFFTTPWRPIGFTVEHFPELFDWTIVPFRDRHVLLNKTEAGNLQAFTDLRFHGGPGETLEMRVFAQSDLIRNFEAAGLVPGVAADPVPKFGIVYPKPWSLPFIVTRVAPGDPVYSSPAVNQSEVERLRGEITSLYQQFDSQTHWNQVLTQRLAEAEKQIAELSQERRSAGNSKWLRLGNRLGLGPKLS